jgi:penicillin-binding protein 2
MARGPIHSHQDADFQRRVYIFSAVPIVLFLTIIVVLFSLQIVKGPQYALRAKTNREQFSILSAVRGIVFDRTGMNVLAYNRRSFAVTVVPQNLPKDPDERSRLLTRLGVLLQMPREDIDAILEQKNYSQYGSFVVKTDVPFKDIVFLAEHNRDFPGVYWKSKPLRVYPSSDSLAHVIGYVGLISQSEYFDLNDKGYNIESVIGKSGVEKVYDLELKGTDGYVRRIVDATNQVTAEIIDRGAEPVPGNNVILTIDRDLQLLAERAFGEQVGALVVSKPMTGEILALVSSPRFDPNFFVIGRDKEAFKKLTLDPQKPFLNRVIQAQYPAGSIFKLVVSLAILDTGMVPVEKRYVCGGGYKLGNRYFSCWTNHGSKVDLYKAIAHSCDSYFYQASLVIGPDVIADYARRMGLGQNTGVDLIGELQGIIPDIQWKRDVKRDVWYDGDTLNLSIGQGFLLVTPIQLNALTNTIANRGILMKPHLVREIRSARNNEIVFRQQPEMLFDTNLDTEHFEFIIRAMRGVVTEGTARWGGAVLSADVAGKTSSSEVQGMKTHSWYTAFAPFNAENPEEVISVTAIIEYGGAGSAAAAPLVSEVIEAYFSGADLDTARRNVWKKRASLSRAARERSRQADTGEEERTAGSGTGGTEAGEEPAGGQSVGGEPSGTGGTEAGEEPAGGQSVGGEPSGTGETEAGEASGTGEAVEAKPSSSGESDEPETSTPEN